MKVNKKPIYKPKRFRLKPLTSLLFLAILAASVLYTSRSLQTPRLSMPKANHLTATPADTRYPTPSQFTAAFAIFTNGTYRTFSAARYHHQSPKAYLQADPLNIIHVQAPGTTWGEFFDTLPMKVTDECLTTGTGQNFCTNQTQQLQFYLNGKNTPHLLTLPIQPKDRLLITYGDQNLDTLNNQWQQVPQP